MKLKTFKDRETKAEMQIRILESNGYARRILFRVAWSDGKSVDVELTNEQVKSLIKYLSRYLARKKSHVNKEKLYTCEFCGEKFRLKSTLSHHKCKAKINLWR